LDFETLDFIIPRFKGTKPNQKLPYQASLHILRNEDGPLEHYEFIKEPSVDPREDMIDFLIKHLEKNGSIVVYNQSFEKTIIKKLGIAYPQFNNQLTSINERVVDLLDVFRQGIVYNKEMGGSFSIKVVYPAMCPESKNAYKNLEEVHNGGDAMVALEELLELNCIEKERRIKQLLEYCKLDTYSMVEIYYQLLKLC
jgi:predicted RecB family nuclease